MIRSVNVKVEPMMGEEEKELDKSRDLGEGGPNDDNSIDIP